MTDIIYRPARLDDIDTFYDLYRLEHIESYGNFSMTKDEVLAEWTFPNFDIDKHSMYAFDHEGHNVAFAELRVWRDIPVRPVIYVYVHPDYRRRGIGSYLTRWGIDAAQQFIPMVPDNARVTLGAFTHQDAGRQLLEDCGFTNSRKSYEMQLSIRKEFPQPVFAEGFRVFTMRDHPILEDFIRVYQETFRDHRGAVDEPLSAAVNRWEAIIQAGSYPPENFILVREGDNDVAVVIASDKSDSNPDQLYVQTVGTMPAYRRRGIATQLMYYVHALARQKGKTSIGLSVDASSLTGATRLYEKIGFTIEKVYYEYVTVIRPGDEISRQA